MTNGEGHGDDRRKGPTAMTDGNDRRVMITARLTGVTDRELEETYGRLEETGGCGRRTLGLLAGGGSADVAGWVNGWQLEETGGCGRQTLGWSMGGQLADVAS